MSSNVLSHIYFLDQVMELDSFLRSYELASDKKDFLAKASPYFSGLIQQSLDNLADLRKQLEKVVIVEVTFAFEPSGLLLEDVAKWIKHNLSEYGIVSYKVDKQLIGGIILSANGKIRDYSIKSKYDQLWQNS
jgi:hypothetical protein